MKIHTIIFLIATAVLHSCKQPALTEEEAINVINKFDDGWNNKNMHIVDSVLSPTYIYFTQSGSTFSRDSLVATAGESTYELHDVNRSEFVVSLDDNAAIVSTRWKGKGIYRGIPFDEDQRCSITVIKKIIKLKYYQNIARQLKQ